MRRRGERGSQSLELLSALPLVGLVVLLCWQGIVLGRQQAEAETDARFLARAAVLCGPAAEPPPLAAADPAAGAGSVSRSEAGGVVSVTVSLPAQSVLPALDRVLAGVRASATVTMRHEPC